MLFEKEHRRLFELFELRIGWEGVAAPLELLNLERCVVCEGAGWIDPDP